MPARSPQQAVQEYLNRLTQIICCVTRDQLVGSVDGYNPSQSHVLEFGRKEGAGSISSGSSRLWLSVIQPYLIVPHGKNWQLDPLGYLYAIRNDQQQELLSFHWHPAGRSKATTPHLHLGHGLQITQKEFVGRHVPTGIVSLAQVVRFVITELKVPALHPDWEQILDEYDS